MMFSMPKNYVVRTATAGTARRALGMGERFNAITSTAND
jgi:hypothetical protein